VVVVVVVVVVVPTNGRRMTVYFPLSIPGK
jgi:hypothetical protein